MRAFGSSHEKLFTSTFSVSLAAYIATAQVCRDVVRPNQDRPLTSAHEIAPDDEHEDRML